jgi:folate-binding protein YgfZ
LKDHALTHNANNYPLNGVASLQHLGVIKITGADAATFINGQLTNDFSLLGLHDARLAAFCTAKGRMQASFIGFKRSSGDVLLVCSRDILQATLKRISQFVMRAKARLSDASQEFAVYGLAGDAIKSIAGRAGSAWAKADFDDISVINLHPAFGYERQLWVGPAERPVPDGLVMTAGLWAWSEVRSAVATISEPVVELFVPQMLNYESVGGVNFKKGCYPGQEVVARSQFRGTLKRRAYLASATQPMQSGDLIFTSSDPEQPVGTVVQATASPLGGFDAIISGQTSAIDAGDLRLLNATGTPMVLLNLPYLLLEDV